MSGRASTSKLSNTSRVCTSSSTRAAPRFCTIVRQTARVYRKVFCLRYDWVGAAPRSASGLLGTLHRRYAAHQRGVRQPGRGRWVVSASKQTFANGSGGVSRKEFGRRSRIQLTSRCQSPGYLETFDRPDVAVDDVAANGKVAAVR
jgi:hypothetical protein